MLLASTSPRRRELLASLGVEFEVFSPPDRELSEEGDHALGPEELAAHNVGTKTETAAEIYPEHAIIAADTIVILQGQAIGKPRDLNHAKQTLHRLSGQTHTVLTALCLRKPKAAIKTELVRTQVTFLDLGQAQIEQYVQTVNVLDKAGAYGYQDHGDWVVKEVVGSESNVIGLPMETLSVWLKAEGYF